AGPEAGRLKYEDTLGEFVTSLLLGNFTGEKASAARAAAGWGGDRIAVFENEELKQRRIVWKSRWDSAADADEFYLAYSAALAAKYPGMRTDSPRSATADERVVLERSGT